MSLIDFPINPTPSQTYQHTYNGITQNWVWGWDGSDGVSAWIAQGFSITAADESSLVAGSNTQIQYNDSGSFGADSKATVVTDSSVSPNSGFSGNFVNYSESVRNDNTSTISSDTSKSLTFGNYNIYTMRDLELSAGVTLTINLSTPTIGQSMTVVLGHSGGADSNIKIPKSESIFWSGGPPGDAVGDGSGATAIIYCTNTRKYDIIYFFCDGTNLYGNFVGDYRKE
jgi:hypothetical protein